MTRPNIVLVVLDDLIAADLTPERAPQWTDLCAHGRQMTRAYAMPVCSQSRACLEFGRYGRSLGITQAMSATEGPEPPASAPTLAGLLKTAGYHTALVGKWHLGRNPNDLNEGCIGAPQARGYDHWLAGSPDNLESYTAWTRVDDDAVTTETVYATIAQEAAARAWWSSTPYPKFLTVRLAAPHGPFHDPSASLLGGYAPDPTLPLPRRRYEKMIRSADWFLGQLRTFPLLSTTTLVCVLSDNGTPENVPGPGQDPEKLKGTSFDGGCRIAMAWWAPPQTFVAQGSDPRLVHLVDVPATLLEAADVAIPAEWDGVGMMSALAGNPGTLRDWCISEATIAEGAAPDRLEQAAITATHKLRRSSESEPFELYDLIADPGETTDIADLEPEIAADLAGILLPSA